MRNPDVDALTKQLEALRIQRERINNEERTIIEALRAASSAESNRGPTSDQSPGLTTRGFRVGDLVLITNKITHLASNRRPTSKDRVGSVTKLTDKRVKIKTHNGHDTSRCPSNVTRLSTQEYEDIVNREQP